MGDGIHRKHCCHKHGCKYGDDDCPVVSGRIRQTHLCEICDSEGIYKVDYLYRDIDFIAMLGKKDVNKAELLTKYGKLFLKVKVGTKHILAEVTVDDFYFEMD